MFDVPVLITIFKRPETTRKLLDVLRVIKPKKLYIFADGARPHILGESRHCDEVRRFVESAVDWPCEVTKEYSAVNLGCGKHIAYAITKAFKSEEQLIILDDDCIPDVSFFEFCRKTLGDYQDNPRVFSISGANYQLGHRRGQESYYFSKFTHNWGWATWKRAWDHYDYSMKDWCNMKNKRGFLKKVLPDEDFINTFCYVFNGCTKSDFKDTTWDYQWLFCSFFHNALNIVPQVNLVSHIGFGPDATNCTKLTHPYKAVPALPMTFPLVHPRIIEANLEADLFTSRHLFNYHPVFYKRVLRKLGLWPRRK